MTYTVLPNSGQSLGITRVPINTNFSLIQSVFDINHVTFNNSGAGKHRLLQIPVVQSASPGTGAGEIAFYTKTVNGAPEWFWQPQSSAPAAADFQMTNSSVLPASFSATLAPAGGSSSSIVTFLPGKFLIVTGIIIGTNGTQKVTFPFNVSTMNSVVVSGNGNLGQPATFYVSTSTTTPASFTVVKSNDKASFNYFMMAQG